jgi:hypothetical protein
MSDNQLVVAAIILALVGAYFAGTTLRDHRRANMISVGNHSGIEPRDVFGFRDRQQRNASRREEWGRR